MTLPTLETNRLTLRPFAPGDWDAINAMLADAEAMQHMHFKTWTEKQRREWFDSLVLVADGIESLDWVIEAKDTGEIIGWFGIGATIEPASAYDISFGYALARTHWNNGYMTEAMRAVFAYEFETLGVPQLSANCRAGNLASARVMEKAGMRREKSDYGADFEGNWSHRHHYIMTRAEYEVRKSMETG
jgi:[ribosomal protein S5]-alanine N-acetyltransferase